MRTLLKVSEGNLPLNKQTVYNYHQQKKYPQLVYKVLGVLFFDMEEWERMADKAKKEAGKK